MDRESKKDKGLEGPIDETVKQSAEGEEKAAAKSHPLVPVPSKHLKSKRFLFQPAACPEAAHG